MISEIFAIVVASSDQFEKVIKTIIETIIEAVFETTFKTVFVKKQLIDLIRKRRSMQFRYNFIKEKIIAFQNFQNVFQSLIFLTHFNQK